MTKYFMGPFPWRSLLIPRQKAYMAVAVAIGKKLKTAL